MQNRKSRNLGTTGLPARRRSGSPMDAYDGLPPALRNWLSQAALPWSATSAKRVWTRAQAKGLGVEGALHSLSQAETLTLARDKRTVNHQINR